MKSKIIDVFPNYIIDTKGNVHSLFIGRILKPGRDKDGYLLVQLYEKGKGKMFKVHRLVATAFIPNPLSKPQVNHINEIKNDNRLENLSWVTGKENMNHGNCRNKISKKLKGKPNTKNRGAGHGLSREKKHYSEKASLRSCFKTSCKRRGWIFEGFSEIYSGEKDNHGGKKYFYTELKEEASE